MEPEPAAKRPRKRAEAASKHTLWDGWSTLFRDFWYASKSWNTGFNWVKNIIQDSNVRFDANGNITQDAPRDDWLKQLYSTDLKDMQEKMIRLIVDLKEPPHDEQNKGSDEARRRFELPPESPASTEWIPRAKDSDDDRTKQQFANGAAGSWGDEKFKYKLKPLAKAMSEFRKYINFAYATMLMSHATYGAMWQNSVLDELPARLIRFGEMKTGDETKTKAAIKNMARNDLPKSVLMYVWLGVKPQLVLNVWTNARIEQLTKAVLDLVQSNKEKSRKKQLNQEQKQKEKEKQKQQHLFFNSDDEQEEQKQQEEQEPQQNVYDQPDVRAEEQSLEEQKSQIVPALRDLDERVKEAFWKAADGMNADGSILPIQFDYSVLFNSEEDVTLKYMEGGMASLHFIKQTFQEWIKEWSEYYYLTPDAVQLTFVGVDPMESGFDDTATNLKMTVRVRPKYAQGSSTIDFTQDDEEKQLESKEQKQNRPAQGSSSASSSSSASTPTVKKPSTKKPEKKEKKAQKPKQQSSDPVVDDAALLPQESDDAILREQENLMLQRIQQAPQHANEYAEDDLLLMDIVDKRSQGEWSQLASTTYESIRKRWLESADDNKELFASVRRIRDNLKMVLFEQRESPKRQETLVRSLENTRGSLKLSGGIPRSPTTKALVADALDKLYEADQKEKDTRTAKKLKEEHRSLDPRAQEEWDLLFHLYQTIRATFAAQKELGSEKDGDKPLQQLKKDIQEAVRVIGTIAGQSRTKIRDTLSRFVTMLEYTPKEMLGYLNMIILGDPGTGKTTLAKTLSRIFSLLHMTLRRATDPVETGNFAAYTPFDLSSSNIGETGKKTASVLQEGLFGFRFIDEAYVLAKCMPGDKQPPRGEGRNLGDEALQAIIAHTGLFPGMNIIALGGYAEQMECLLQFDPGFPRRFPIRIHVPNLDATDMVTGLFRRLYKWHMDERYDMNIGPSPLRGLQANLGPSLIRYFQVMLANVYVVSKKGTIGEYMVYEPSAEDPHHLRRLHTVVNENGAFLEFRPIDSSFTPHRHKLFKNGFGDIDVVFTHITRIVARIRREEWQQQFDHANRIALILSVLQLYVRDNLSIHGFAFRHIPNVDIKRMSKNIDQWFKIHESGGIADVDVTGQETEESVPMVAPYSPAPVRTPGRMMTESPINNPESQLVSNMMGAYMPSVPMIASQSLLSQLQQPQQQQLQQQQQQQQQQQFFPFRGGGGGGGGGGGRGRGNAPDATIKQHRIAKSRIGGRSFTYTRTTMDVALENRRANPNYVWIPTVLQQQTVSGLQRTAGGHPNGVTYTLRAAPVDWWVAHLQPNMQTFWYQSSM